jgi:hypothetical protein
MSSTYSTGLRIELQTSGDFEIITKTLLGD